MRNKTIKLQFKYLRIFQIILTVFSLNDQIIEEIINIRSAEPINYVLINKYIILIFLPKYIQYVNYLDTKLSVFEFLLEKVKVVLSFIFLFVK